MSSIEEIVIAIQNGNNRRNELYPLIKGLVYKLCYKYCATANKHYYELDDLLSVAWFGVERAINSYTPEKEYAFVSYLNYHIRNVICEFLGLRGTKQIQTISLEEPIPGVEELTIGDTVKDETTDELFDRVEYETMSEDIWQEVSKLPDNERTVIEDCYRRNMTYGAVADELGISGERVRQIKQKALRKLRKSPYIREYSAEYFAYRHTTLKTFNTTRTSSTEWAVLKALSREEAVKNLTKPEKNLKSKTCQNLTFKVKKC